MCFSKSTKPPTCPREKRPFYVNEQVSTMDIGQFTAEVVPILRIISTSPGVHSRIHMKAAGFTYIGLDDTARCEYCKLTVSQWNKNMAPLSVHKEKSPFCPFFASISSTMSPSEERAYKRLKIDHAANDALTNIIIETENVKEIRRTTFSHWPSKSLELSSQIIQAGFFSCNVNDRVICIYCNIICEQWNQNTDDPLKVHKAISPKCPYIVAMSASTSQHALNDEGQAHKTALNSNYVAISERYASFGNWSNQNMPKIDDLVKAGFFAVDKDTLVTCFYCNGSLQNLNANDNPIIEHVRRFPHCDYAKQSCGTEFYRRIQEAKSRLQEQVIADAENMGIGTILIPDESTLSRLVAARLDLPISKRLLDQNFKLSVIKRCWEDQLRLKQTDFTRDSHLWMACKILCKQIDIIKGNNENIIVPHTIMERIPIDLQSSSNQRRTSIYCTSCIQNDWNLALLLCTHT